MYVTEQVADVPVPLRVHGEPVKVPVLLVAKLTVPDGVLAVPTSVSVTVTPHVAATPTLPVAGQLTTVLVARRLTVTLVEPLLPVWIVDPP